MSFDSGGFFNSTSNPETNTYNQNAGFSEIGGSAQSLNLVLGKKSKGNTINLLDLGAIERAFGFGAQALNQVELAGSRANAIAAAALEAVNVAGRSEGENLALTVVKWGAILGGLYLVVRAFRGS